jgi:hypothetical protein
LRRYLTGELSEADRLRIAQLCFENDEASDELQDIEYELLDKFVRGELNDRERNTVEGYLKNLPDRQSKLSVATVLAKVSVEDREMADRLIRKHRTPIASRLSALEGFFRPRITPSYLAAAGVFLAVVISVVLLEVLQLQNANRDLREKIADLERQQASSPDANEADEHIARLEEQLRIERLANEDQARRLSQLQPVNPVVASWILSPSTRSADTPESVNLAGTARFVLITMPVEGIVDAPAYRVIIQTTTGEQLRTLQGSRVNHGVVVRLRADYFKNATYKITLIGGPTTTELSWDYYFTVNRR